MLDQGRDQYRASQFERFGYSVLWIIYAAIAALALVTIGGIQLYKHLNPETPAEQFAHAVDALDSGQDLIAHRLFEKLAASGNPAAEYWLADLYEHGLGTAKDLPRAVALLQASANKRFVPAQLRLGELYLAGVENDPNYSRAKDLLSKAALAGNAEAQRLLGQMYAAGLGEPRDPFVAAVYYSAAVVHGDRLADPERANARAQLTPDQIAQIEPEMTKLGLLNEPRITQP